MGAVEEDDDVLGLVLKRHFVRRGQREGLVADRGGCPRLLNSAFADVDTGDQSAARGHDARHAAVAAADVGDPLAVEIQHIQHRFARLFYAHASPFVHPTSIKGWVGACPAD